MDLFDALALLGGLSLFLFGMNLMGQALERRAGSGLRNLLGKLTNNRFAGFLTGAGVTAVIQSSSATTVMVVGFVNSGVMTLRQSINVILGANVGTTITAWILSLSGISGENLLLQLLKPTSFTPVLALVGIILFMFTKSSKKRDTGIILLGFAVLMFGMDAMTESVSGLANVPAFGELFLLFQNPILGVLAGAVLTAIIQSSSASVGILQALAVTGAVPFGAAIPIIMGQNIGTCVTAMISTIGANKNAKRTALVHLSFNVIGTVVWLAVFSAVNAVLHPALFADPATQAGIAIAHTVFNLLCTALLLPASGLLEKLVCILVPDSKTPEVVTELDERLLSTPSVALARCNDLTVEMSNLSVAALKESLQSLSEYSDALAESIREKEERSDHYEDILGTYLVKLGGKGSGDDSSGESAKLLKLIGDFERISDHAVNILESAEELREKGIGFTEQAQGELQVITAAVTEILDLTLQSYHQNDLAAAAKAESLEQVVDLLKEELRMRHILRLQAGNCSIDAGFVWSDLLTNLERTADHCNNIVGCIIDMANRNMNMHEMQRSFREGSEEYRVMYESYADKYKLPAV